MSPTERFVAADPDLVSALEDACALVGARATDRRAGAHDASHCLLTPQAVATVSGIDEVVAVLKVSRESGVPITFRSGGTSLSGQAGTDGILVDTRKQFRRITTFEAGTRVRAQPGATVRAVNAQLARHGRKLGPDPASEIACTIGGVVANNSSGMSCGTHSNTYQTMESMVLVLPSGTIVDTSMDDADALLRQREPGIYAGLELLRERVRSNPDSVAILRRLHSIKNTMGYGLNSFLDHTTPLDILQHLVIGSEGTLAFVAETTFRTVPVKPHLATGLLIFETLHDATSSLPALVEAGFAAIELLDAASLRVAQQDPEATDELTDLIVSDHAALLVEFQEESVEELEMRVATASTLFSALPLAVPGVLTADTVSRAQLWHIRKGLFTAVAGARPSGTTALLEDIAVPVDRLNDTCTELSRLFERYGYEGSVIFGHAKDGNIHFLINEQFDEVDQLARYAAFTDDMVELVLGQGGTLKAEHGTGRIMAPYVARQYGPELHDVMKEVKRLIDPGMLLNPGVLITDDPDAHVKHLKTSPSVESEVDRCVECGYCEPVCPSRDLTLTPRERIVLRRELESARARGDHDLARTLEAEYEYDGIQTCAVDGMCQSSCPVLINTGDLIRRLRAENQNSLSQAGWKAAAKSWDVVSRVGGTALTVANFVPDSLPTAATRVARAVLGAETVPLYARELPPGGVRRSAFSDADAVAVFFSSCTTTMFGPVGDDGVAESLLRLCERADVALRTPDDIPSLCCGTPWKSKGLSDGYAVMKKRVTESLMRASDGGRLPVICDASSCTEGLEALLESADDVGIRVIDAVAFVDEFVLPKLPAGQRQPQVVLHPTCSSTRLGINSALNRVAAAAADTVIVPEDWGCCAFAGDRGLLHPELTSSATAAEAANVAAAGPAEHASLNRTCELGMTRAVGEEYKHILQILDETLRT